LDEALDFGLSEIRRDPMYSSQCLYDLKIYLLVTFDVLLFVVFFFAFAAETSYSHL